MGPLLMAMILGFIVTSCICFILECVNWKLILRDIIKKIERTRRK